MNTPSQSTGLYGAFTAWLNRRKTGVMLVCAAIISFLLLAMAWVGEDSYIGWRVSDNIFRGHGPVWNVGERVQIYSHTLFFFLITAIYALWDNVYQVCVAFGLLSTLIYVYTVYRQARFEPVAIIVLSLALVSSKAFMEYAICGLENPLSYMLAGFFVIQAFRYQDGLDRAGFPKLLATASLIYLTHPDTVLICIPLLLWEGVSYISNMWRSGKVWQAIGYSALAFSPVILWTSFSVFYYGLPFPVTYYYKVKSGIGGNVLVAQGLNFYLFILRTEPQTLGVIALALVLGAVSGRRVDRLLTLGLALFLLYVLKVGADYMAGRFLSVPVAVALILIAGFMARGNLTTYRMSLAACLVFCVVGLVVGSSPIRPQFDYHCKFVEKEHQYEAEPFSCIDYAAGGISEERAFYYRASGLVPLMRKRLSEIKQQFIFIRMARYQFSFRPKVVVLDPVGYGPYYLRDSVYVFDSYGLAGNFLPWMPHIDYGTPFLDWRPGHIRRRQPAGLIASTVTNTNAIVNPYAARLYDRCLKVTKGDLLAPGRINAIWALNTEAIRYDSLRFPVERTVDFEGDNLRIDPMPGYDFRYLVKYPLNAGSYQIRVLTDTATSKQFRVMDRDNEPIPFIRAKNGIAFQLTLSKADNKPLAHVYANERLSFPGIVPTIVQIDTALSPLKAL